MACSEVIVINVVPKLMILVVRTTVYIVASTWFAN